MSSTLTWSYDIVCLVRGTGGKSVSHLDDLFADLPETLRVSQVAKLLNKSNQGVLRWISSGTLSAYKLGDTWFILREDLRDALSAGGNLHDEGDSPQDS